MIIIELIILHKTAGPGYYKKLILAKKRKLKYIYIYKKGGGGYSYISAWGLSGVAYLLKVAQKNVKY